MHSDGTCIVCMCKTENLHFHIFLLDKNPGIMGLILTVN